MANTFVTVLDKIGDAFKDFFKIALPVAEAAEPIIAVALPAISGLYNMTVALVSNAEGAAAAAGAQSGTGPQKLALVLAALQPYLAQESATLGIAAPTVTQTTAYVNAIVASLNAFGSIPASPAPTVVPTLTTQTQGTVTVEETK